MNPGIIRPERARELANRPSSDALNILSAKRLVVSAKRASELLQNVGMIRLFAKMVLRTYERMHIVSNHNLYLTLCPTRDNKDMEQSFIHQFRVVSEVSYRLSSLEVCFFRDIANCVTRRWVYYHKYF